VDCPAGLCPSPGDSETEAETVTKSVESPGEGEGGSHEVQQDLKDL
jgi:hypothetical protein